jgi:MFS family permease
MTLARRFGARTFAALAIPNYRRYFAGQAVSLVGTWMQTIAMGWLLLTLTGSGAQLGALIAVQTLPVLVLGPYGGVVADRVDKRRLMILVQTGLGTVALALGLLVASGAVQVWHVFVLAGVLGLLTVFDNPARQSFVLEMVGPDDLRNAVTLNSVLVNAARAVGPAVAGILIATVGVSVCFLLNAASYVAVIVSLATLEVAALQPSEPAPRGPGQLREGVRYVRATPALAIPLGMMALIGTLAYEFQVVLPIVARSTFGGGPETYGFMTAAMGAGAVVGGLIVAGSGRTGVRAIVLAATAFGIAILLAAAAPDLTLELVALTIVGACSVTFIAIGNSTLQLTTRADMRGRVMGLWAVAFLGTTPLGGPIVGVVAEQFGGRAGLVLGGTACLVAAAMGVLALRRAQTLMPSTSG